MQNRQKRANKKKKKVTASMQVKAKNNVILRCVKVAAPSPQEISTHNAHCRVRDALIRSVVHFPFNMHHLHASHTTVFRFVFEKFGLQVVRSVLYLQRGNLMVFFLLVAVVGFFFKSIVLHSISIVAVFFYFSLTHKHNPGATIDTHLLTKHSSH